MNGPNHTVLHPYLVNVRREFGVLRWVETGSKEGVKDVSLSSMYVPVRVSNRHIQASEPPEEWGETLNILDAAAQNPVLAVLGDPGSGKSTVVGWLSYMLADAGNNVYRDRLGSKIPLPMILRDMNVSPSTTWETLLESFVDQRFAKGSITVETVIELLAAGRAYVLVDGFDEASGLSARKAVQSALEWAQDCYLALGNRWLLTSRIVGYNEAVFQYNNVYEIILHEVEELEDRLDWVGPRSSRQTQYPEVVYKRHFAPTVYVTPFTDAERRQFVYNWYAARETSEVRSREEAGDFLRLLADRQDLTELSVSPQILTLMCLVHRVKTVLPHGRAKLYEEVATCYLESFPRRRKLTVPYPLEQSLRWLARVGFEMQKLRQPARHGTIDPAQGVIVNLDTLKAWLENQAREEGQPTSEVDAFVQFVVERGGLLVERGEGKFAFLHLSFQEYFAARYLDEAAPWRPRSTYLADLGLDGTAASNTISNEVLTEWADSSIWAETLTLLGQIAAPSSVADLVGFLTTALKNQVDSYLDKQDINGQRPTYLGEVCSPLVQDPFSELPVTLRAPYALILLRLEHAWQHAPMFADFLPGHLPYRLLPAIPLANIIRDSLLSGQWSQLCERWTQLRPLRETESNISGVEQFTNLTFLDLNRSQVSDLSPIAQLTNLTSLDLSSTQVSDLSPIANLTNLQSLDLSSTQVTDLSPIAHLTNLTSLLLNHAQVSDLSPIARLINLTSLHLNHTQVSDLGPIAQLANLNILDLGHTQINDFNPIAQLTHLTVLHVNDTQITDLSLIGKLSTLTRLDFASTQVDNIAPIAGHTGLKELFLDNTPVEDITPLMQLKELATLAVHSTKFSELSRTISLPSLKLILTSEEDIPDEIFLAFRAARPDVRIGRYSRF